MTKYIDLHYELSRLIENKSVSRRLEELSENIPRVSICAVGGFPIRKASEIVQSTNTPVYLWMDKSVRYIKTMIIRSLGVSGLLTFTNKSNLTMDELGQKCLELNHTWAFRWVNFTLAFAKFPLKVQLAFARDSRFYLGWTEEPNNSQAVFTVTGSLKDWKSYISHRTDASFDSDTRRAMREASIILDEFYRK